MRAVLPAVVDVQVRFPEKRHIVDGRLQLVAVDVWLYLNLAETTIGNDC